LWNAPGSREADGRIIAATSLNAEIMGWGDKVGAIEPGKFADLIAVAGDPLADIKELTKVGFVMKGGSSTRTTGKNSHSNPNSSDISRRSFCRRPMPRWRASMCSMPACLARSYSAGGVRSAMYSGVVLC